MLRVCDMYYNKDFSQVKIARLLSLSRPTVKKFLIGAKEKGFVNITISDLNGRSYLDLERQLETKLGLRDVIISDSVDNDSEQINCLAKAAVGYLESIVKDGDIIGMSMGTTLARMPDFVSKTNTYLTFVPMLGGIGEVIIDYHSNNIVERMARAFGAEALSLHAPSMVSRIQAKRELLKEQSIRKTLDYLKRLDIAIIGIGTADRQSAIASTGYYTEEMFTEMAQKHACGDICMWLYDRFGNTSIMKSNEYLIGTDVNNLKKIPHSIGVAGGERKVDAILGAIRGGFINTLVTDHNCAQGLNKCNVDC